MDSPNNEWTESCLDLFLLLTTKSLEDIRKKLIGKPVSQEAGGEAYSYSSSIEAIEKIDACPDYVNKVWRESGFFWLILKNGYVILISNLKGEHPFYALFVNSEFKAAYGYGLKVKI
jgi:hypothetical protein